jgi:DNA (cytosine-5)-methyltransferase 1
MGYHRAGFDVVGIDIDSQPHYPFEFVQQDALRVLKNEEGRFTMPLRHFDAIHASPPCQAYTTMGNRHQSPSSPPLISEVRQLLERTCLPWVIENVPGALADMRSPLELTGEIFGLRVHRPRLFESNVMLLSPPRPPRQANPVAVYGKNDGRRLWTRKDGSELRCASLEDAQEAMGMDWADWHGTKEAIPPAYTEFIGRQLLKHLSVAQSTSVALRED